MGQAKRRGTKAERVQQAVAEHEVRTEKLVDALIETLNLKPKAPPDNRPVFVLHESVSPIVAKRLRIDGVRALHPSEIFTYPTPAPNGVLANE
jgi:hypothetical protein